MIVGGRPAGHVEAGGASHRVGVVLVLHAQPGAQRRIREVGDVPRGIHIRMTGAAELVHQNSVVHRQARLLRQLHRRRDAQSRHQDLGHELAARSGAHHARPRAPIEPRHPLPHAHRDSLLPIVVHEEARHIGGKHPGAEPRLRDEHRHVASLHPERRGDFAPDKAAADHAEAHALARERAQPAVVVERAVIDDLVRLERQLSRHPAGGEQQLREAVFRAPVVRRLVRP